jgi:septal ring factor EnvC (AmiA/AmiB activator)
LPRREKQKPEPDPDRDPAAGRTPGAGGPRRERRYSTEEDLAALRARIESMRAELEGRESDRREAREALRASEVAISAASRALLAHEAEAREARAAISQLAAQRAAQERALHAQQGALGRLLAARALSGGGPASTGVAPDFVRIALSGEDLSDAARRLHYLTYISQGAARMIQAHRAALAELAALKERSEGKANELAAIEMRGRAERDQLLRERRERRRVLERIAVEVRDAKRRIQALVADEARLSRLVEEIGKVLHTRPGAGYRQVRGRADNVRAVPEVAAGALSAPFSALKGRLRLPVRGELIGRFGAQHRGAMASGKGVFIRTAEGEQVRAVATGQVVYADWMRGFGNLLIVDHGEGFLSIYGNNESLLKQTGDPVSLGEALAVAGQSGGNEETGLYFELRHLGRPFDPISWVRHQ